MGNTVERNERIGKRGGKARRSSLRQAKGPTVLSLILGLAMTTLGTEAAGEPHNPLLTGELPQYVFFWAGNSEETWGPHPLTANYCNEIINAVGTRGHSRLRIGVSITFDILERDTATLVGWLREALRVSEETDMPLLIVLDGERHWASRGDLWNWWDPSKPGYNPDNANNVEWYDWGPEYATKIAWRDWGAGAQRIKPEPNLASPAFLQANWEKYQALVPIIAAWYRSLSPERKYLFGGLKVGWETTIIANSMYFPNGNWYLETYPNNSSHDPSSGYGTQYGWTFGVQKTGYAAATASGIKTSGNLTMEDHEAILHEYMEQLSREAYNGGIPRHLIFTHQGIWTPYEQHARGDQRLFDSWLHLLCD